MTVSDGCLHIVMNCKPVIVDDLETRNKLSSPEHVLEMARRMKNRPLFAYKEKRHPIEVTGSMNKEQISGEQEYVLTMGANSLAMILINTKEPREKVKISITTNTIRPVIIEEMTIQLNKMEQFDPVNERPVDILDQMYCVYKEAEKKVLEDDKILNNT